METWNDQFYSAGRWFAQSSKAAKRRRGGYSKMVATWCAVLGEAPDHYSLNDKLYDTSSAGEIEAWRDALKAKCPYGQSGDCLWVRETHAFLWPDESGYTADETTGLERLLTNRECNVEYRTDTNNPYPGDWPEDQAKGCDEAPKWKPSIHMPRFASRITLEIVNVRVERLQDISEADATAEGIEEIPIGPGPNHFHDEHGCFWPDARTAYAELWGNINGGGSWHKNPWVWVVEFKPL